MMTRLSCLLFSCLFSIAAFSQDDYPDYRSKRELFTRIQEKDIRADVASFAMGGIEESVGKTPLRRLPITNITPNSISFGEGNTSVTIQGGQFNPDKHKITYYNDKYVVKIDNKGYFGEYGKIPKTTIESITIIIDRDTIRVPQAAFADIYNPIFSYKDRGVEKSYNNVYFSADGNRMYIYMLKRELGGSYEVTWILQNKQYLKRVVDFGFLK